MHQRGVEAGITGEEDFLQGVIVGVDTEEWKTLCKYYFWSFKNQKSAVNIQVLTLLEYNFHLSLLSLPVWRMDGGSSIRNLGHLFRNLMSLN
jgi:hypothetical protein